MKKILSAVCLSALFSLAFGNALALDSFNSLDLGTASGKQDVYAMPCKSFNALTPAGKTLVAAFLLGDTAPESGSESYSPADVAADLRLLEKRCAASPSAGVGETLESAEPEDDPAQSTVILPVCMAFNNLKDATSAGAMLAWTVAYVTVSDNGGAGILDFGGFKALGNTVLKQCAAAPAADVRRLVTKALKGK